MAEVKLDSMIIDTSDAEEKEERFMEVEKIFRDLMDKKYDANQVPLTDQKICCDEAEAAQYIIFADIFKTISPYNQLSLKDIYKVLIFTDYSLDKNEHGWWLKMADLQTLFDSKQSYSIAKKLFIDITTSDGHDPSVVRRFILKMPGGRKKRKKRRRKKKKKKTRRRKKHSRTRKKGGDKRRRKKRTRKR